MRSKKQWERKQSKQNQGIFQNQASIDLSARVEWMTKKMLNHVGYAVNCCWGISTTQTCQLLHSTNVRSLNFLLMFQRYSIFLFHFCLFQGLSYKWLDFHHPYHARGFQPKRIHPILGSERSFPIQPIHIPPPIPVDLKLSRTNAS